MKMVEVIGGLYINMDNEQYIFYKKIVSYCRKNKTDYVPLNKLTERQRIVAQRLVDSHVLDRRDGKFIIRVKEVL